MSTWNMLVHSKPAMRNMVLRIHDEFIALQYDIAEQCHPDYVIWKRTSKLLDKLELCSRALDALDCRDEPWRTSCSMMVDKMFDALIDDQTLDEVWG